MCEVAGPPCSSQNEVPTSIKQLQNTKSDCGDINPNLLSNLFPFPAERAVILKVAVWCFGIGPTVFVLPELFYLFCFYSSTIACVGWKTVAEYPLCNSN